MVPDDPTLLCSFSFGRPNLVRKTLPFLISSKRSCDKLLIIDQEMRLFNLYAKYRNDIDYLIFLQSNYAIAPVYIFILELMHWLQYNRDTFTDGRKWYPRYICLIESDAVGYEGWLGRLIRVLKDNIEVGIVTGHEQPEHIILERKGKILIKQTARGTQLLMSTDHFISLVTAKGFSNLLSPDWELSNRNRGQGKKIAVLPYEIIHLGRGKGLSLAKDQPESIATLDIKKWDKLRKDRDETKT